MARGSLVAVSYPVDGEFVQINTSVLDGLAEVAFLDGAPDAEFLDTLRQADVLIGWHLGQELPAGALQASPGLRLIQLLSAGADSVDFAAIPEPLTLASNVGAYAEPMNAHHRRPSSLRRRHRQVCLASSLRTAFSAWSRVARSPKSQSLPSSPSAEAIVRPSSYCSTMRGSM